MIQQYIFTSEYPGPKVLFFGAIHGREQCGTKAINSIIQKFESGALQLLKGSVAFVPICNPRAYRRRVRYIDEDLNRVFRNCKTAQTYESKLAQELIRLVQKCDVFLDLHSFSAQGKPFVFLDYPNQENKRLASVLGVSNAVVGWNELYARAGSPIKSFDTIRYACERGKRAVLLECGNHTNRASVQVAKRAIMSVLVSLGLVRGRSVASTKTFTRFRLSQMFTRNHIQDRFQRSWTNLESVKRGVLVARRSNGESIYAKRDCRIFFPKKDANVGDEWFYFVSKLR